MYIYIYIYTHTHTPSTIIAGGGHGHEQLGADLPARLRDTITITIIFTSIVIITTIAIIKITTIIISVITAVIIISSTITIMYYYTLAKDHVLSCCIMFGFVTSWHRRNFGPRKVGTRYSGQGLGPEYLNHAWAQIIIILLIITIIMITFQWLGPNRPQSCGASRVHGQCAKLLIKNLRDQEPCIEKC